MAILYSRQQFSRMMKECGLTAGEKEYIHENVFGAYPAGKAGLHEIAAALADLMLGRDEQVRATNHTGVPANILSGQEEQARAANEDDTEKYIRGSEPYERCVRLAGLLIRMIINEQDIYKDICAGDRHRDPAEVFLEDFGDVFSEEVISIYVMEVAAETFIDGFQEGLSNPDGKYLWLRHIFELTHIYDRLTPCCRSVRTRSGNRADEFFLRLLLLYRCLETPFKSERKDEADPRKSTLLIRDIITESGPADGNIFSYSRTKNETILEVLESYINYVSDRDVEYLLKGMFETINSMALASADILIKALSAERPEREDLLRLEYIDSSMFYHLFSELTKQEEGAYARGPVKIDILLPEGENSRCIFVRRNRRQLVRLSREKDTACMKAESRDGMVFKRENADRVDWTDDELQEAGLLCQHVFNLPSGGSSFLFSYVHIEDYRTVDKVSVSFDHRYDLVNGKLIKKDPELSSAYFYGEHIYSLTCLVGKNGAGKSSIVDFLRESFLAVKEDAEKGRVVWNGRTLQLGREDEERYHLLWGDKLTRFLVVFNVEGKDYYLTNFGEDKVDCSSAGDIRPYEYSEAMNFTEEDCTFAYFSQLRYPTGVYASRFLGEEDDYREIIDRYVRNLSEEISDRQRNQGGVININESLVHQLVYLTMAGGSTDRPKGIPAADECAEYNQLAIIREKEDPKIFIKDIAEKSEAVNEKLLIERIRDPKAFIGQFSSGQHSRIALLSQIYWCLAGSQYFFEKYKDTWPGLCEVIREFETGIGNGRRSVLDPSDTGVLFFDEGDLCFHPEWQRSYIYDIVRMVDSLREKDVQIIVTTNSPFMLSDILREDVYTMFGYRNSDMAEFDPELQTYGQNIHMLLAHRFFLNNTMGKMSEETLTWLFRLFEKYQKTKESKKDNERLEGLRKDVLERCGKYLRAQGGMAFPGAAEHSEDAALADTAEHSEVVTLPEIQEFLNDLIDGVGERVYRRALRDGFERCFRSR